DPAGVLNAGDDPLELGELRIAGLLQLPVAAAQAEVLGVEHVRVQVGPDLGEVERGQNVLVEVWRRQRLGETHFRAPDRRRGQRILLVGVYRRGRRGAA